MNKEEKKAIKDCDTIFMMLEDMLSEDSTNDYRKSYLIIKTLIETQQKEIEELKDKNKSIVYNYEMLVDKLENSTPNTKIKAKIKELERDKNKLYKEQGNIEDIKIYSVIDIIKAEILRFKELLEEE